ncbi:MAG TPA: hypothetical protein VFW71_07160 [Actinomycetota bacterium]|nr:hypothetical protein [Actinomycetota bacterium]
MALTAGGWLVLGHWTQHHQPTPGNSASPPGGTPSLPAPVPATTFEAFAALPADQQQAVMLEVMNRFNEVVNQSSERLDASVLPLVATGDELGALKQRFQTLQQSGYGLSTGTQVTVLRVVMSPQPYSFVSIHIQSTETAQYVKPTTLEPVGSPAPATSVTSSFSFVIEDGTWKASEHFQDFKK